MHLPPTYLPTYPVSHAYTEHYQNKNATHSGIVDDMM